MKNKIVSTLLVVIVGFFREIYRFYLNKPKIGLILLSYLSLFTLMLMGINNIAE
ncbi:MAG: hypothetical protein CM15mP56_2820 [Alphaproteobacteria bacterium]|nr:MAG: hypothetical protein CM15mP56_2820 [Alphaproteobacteria bacterium]